MQTLLEYIKKKSSSNYETVKIHTNSAKNRDGIEINDLGCHFILWLNNLGEFTWNTARIKAENVVRGGRLPNNQEWAAIDKNRERINELLLEIHGQPIDDDYWSLDGKNTNNPSVDIKFFYSSYKGRMFTTNEYTINNTRMIIPIK